MAQQNCTCGNNKTSEKSTTNRSQAVQTVTFDSDVFYDFPDENDAPIPKTSSKLLRSESVTVLMQKIANPQYFKEVLQNLVETAENLVVTFERTLRQSLDKFQKAVAGLSVPVNSFSAAGSQTTNDPHSDECAFCGNRLNITVDPVVVNVPLTLYLTPKIRKDSSARDEFTPTIFDDVGSLRDAVKDDSIEDVESQTILKEILSDEFEPIRTASISVGDERLSQAPCGLPKIIRFSTELSQSEEHDDTILKASPKSEFDFEQEDPEHHDPGHHEAAEKEDFIDGTRTTQNDRHRDHTNLSIEPNIEEARHRHQPAKQKETTLHQQAEDNNQHHQNRSLDFAPSGSGLCSNLSQDGFNNNLKIGHSTVKLSFSTGSKGFQGSYECFFKEGEEDKFWYQNKMKTRDQESAEKMNTDASNYECLCVRKSLLVACTNENPILKSGSRALDTTEAKRLSDFCGRSDKKISNTTQDQCSYEDSSTSRSVGTVITPRPTMDENVVPLLQNIFDVLQTMRHEKHHLGPLASRDINEPFNSFQPPPVPPSSPEDPMQLLRTSQLTDQSLDFEPPERDVEDFEKSPLNSQRLIPVDMDLLRTDEELIWEPDLNLNNLKVEEAHAMPLQDQELNSQCDEEETSPQDQTDISQEVQVNQRSLENLTLDSQLEEQLEDLLSTNNFEMTTTKQDIATDCPGFENTGESTLESSNQNQDMRHFIESILLDLKAMNSARTWHSFAKLPCPTTGGWQRPSKDLSYPATIESVQELGTNSLFVKWRVQNIGNIGGYELFLDGHLTNRYFNCMHRAAVICDVNLHCPHRITLRANPLLPQMTSSSHNTTTSHHEASCPQSDGSVWYPSVYHFEPNSLSAPTK